jgi:hypothetical protein
MEATPQQYQESIENFKEWMGKIAIPEHEQPVRLAIFKKQIGYREVSNELLFPDVMHGVAGNFAEVYSHYLETPPHFLYMAYLTCLGSVLADTLRLNTELKTEPRLYTILLGESADDRKSTALRVVTDFFKDTVEGFGLCWGVGSAEGLQKRFKDNARLLLVFDEFKQFVNKCKIEGSVLLPCVNILFENNSYENTTKSKIEISEGKLSMLGASTLDTYELMWSSAFTDIGFTNRLFIVPGKGEKRFSIPTKMPMETRGELKQDLRTVLSMVGEGLELSLEPDAFELYDTWYKELKGSVHTKRLDTYSLRLMGLLAVNELKDTIDVNIVKKAIALADWQHEVRVTFDPIDAESTIAKVEEKIRRALSKGGVTKTELKRLVHYSRYGMWIYNTAVKNLVNANEIQWVKELQQWVRLA